MILDNSVVWRVKRCIIHKIKYLFLKNENIGSKIQIFVHKIQFIFIKTKYLFKTKIYFHKTKILIHKT